MALRFRCHFKSDAAFAYMDTMRSNKHHCDVTLVANNAEIGAHKIVLAAFSLFFHKKFFMEKKQDYLVIEGIEYKILRELVDYIYTSELTITHQNVKDLLEASDKLMLLEVRKECCSYLERYLDPSNCLSTAALAKELNLFDLVEASKRYAGAHFLEFTEHDEFLLASYQEIYALVSPNKRIVEDEKILDAILIWIHYDSSSRRGVLDELLEHVDMSNIPPEYLMKQLDEPLLKDNFLFLSKAMHALRDYHKQLVKKFWSSQEKQRVFELFHTNISNKTLPSLAVCKRIVSEDDLLRERTAESLKAYINNINKKKQ